MTYIENIFLCLALPMLLSLLFTSGSPRRFTLFVADRDSLRLLQR